MADAARKLMTVEEFLEWDDGTETRYDLVEGVLVPKGPILNRSGEVVGMAPAARVHRILAAKLLSRISRSLADRPGCEVEPEAGIRTASARSFFHADLAVSCAPLMPKQLEVPSPTLIVEVLSPSTQTYDRRTKLPAYKQIASVQEILLIDPARPFCEVYRRLDAARWTVDHLTELSETLRLDSVCLSVSLDELYAGLPLEDDLGIAYGTPEA